MLTTLTRDPDSNNRASRNILVAVAGGSPAIVTETLWALTKEKDIRVDEVRIITTEKGKAAIRDTLLPAKRGTREKSAKGGRSAKGSRFASCLKELDLRHEILFNEETVFVLADGKGGNLQDIRTDEDNQLASDQICNLIREWTNEPNTRLYCSAAGGRKTMSIYLTIAMMLYGRVADKLFHVLINPEEFERCKDFFNPFRQPRKLTLADQSGKSIKKLSTADVRIDLGEIPFVRLRVMDTSSIFGETLRYSEIVETVQERLEFLTRAASSHLRIHGAQFYRSRIPVEVAGKTCDLETAPGFVYTLVAEDRKLRGQSSGIEVDLLSVRDLKRVFRLLTGSEFSEMLEGTEFDFVAEWVKLLRSRDPDLLERFKGAIQVNKSRANKSLKKADFPRRFWIVNLKLGKRGKQSQGAMYTINLPGDAIHLPSF